MRGAGTRWQDRGQAIQLGALLLFAILIINLSLFQIFVVPDQNGEIEFKHSEEVRSDMLDARNAVLDAATGDQSFVEVDLAPAYPSRSLFVNPATPAGTVRTTELQPVTIINDTGGASNDISSDACPGTPETRALEYRAGYNYYTNAPTYRVENTVLFREFPGETLPGSGQQLVTDDDINLLPVRNDFSESGTGAATVEPVPGGVLTTNVVDPEIELPTAYSEPVWEGVLSGTVPASDISVSGGTLTLSLSGSYSLNCGPIGVNGAPPSGARSGGLAGSGGSGGGGGSINPADFSEVRLTSVSEGSGNSEIEITLKNTDDDAKSLARARIPFYYGATGGSSARPNYADLNGDSADRLGIRDRFETIDQDIELAGNGGTQTLTFEFDENVKDDFFVFKVAYSDGTRSTYYIDAVKSSGGSPTATPTPTPTPTAVPGGPGFITVTASTLDAGETGGGAEQTLTFTPDQDLANGETVSIDLSDAQDATGANANQYQVDYQSASPTVVSGSGSVQFTTQSSTGAVIEFTSNGVSAGDTVEIEVTGITTGSTGQQNDPYDAVFDRSDGGSQTTTFLVN